MEPEREFAARALPAEPGSAPAGGAPRDLLRRREHEPGRAHRPGHRSPRRRSHGAPHRLHRRRQLEGHRPRHGSPPGAPRRPARPQRALGRRARLERPSHRRRRRRLAGRRSAGRRDGDRHQRPGLRRGRGRGIRPGYRVPPALLPGSGQRTRPGAHRGAGARGRGDAHSRRRRRGRRHSWRESARRRAPAPAPARRPASAECAAASPQCRWPVARSCRAPRLAATARSRLWPSRIPLLTTRSSPSSQDLIHRSPNARGHHRHAGQRAEVARVQPDTRLSSAHHAPQAYQGDHREPVGDDRARHAGGADARGTNAGGA